MEPYYVIHKDTTTIKFPHQLSYSEFPHIDLVYLSKSELLKDVLRSYSSIKNVWNAFVVDGVTSITELFSLSKPVLSKALT